MDKFWILWSPQGVTPPRKRYPSTGAAQLDAEVMAKKCPSQEFYVMEGVYHFAISGVTMTRLESEAERKMMSAAFGSWRNLDGNEP